MRKIVIATMVMMVLIPLALVAANCGADTKEAETNLCRSLDEFMTALIAMGDISLDATVEDIQHNFDPMQDAWNKIVSDAAKVAEAKSDDLEKAYQDLEKAVDNLPGDATITEALESIKDEASAVADAWEQMFSDLDCEALLSEE